MIFMCVVCTSVRSCCPVCLIIVFLHARIVSVPGKVLLILSLLSGLPGLGHISPVREGLEQTTDVLVFGPGCTDGQLLLTLDYTPEGTQTHNME